MSQFPDVGYCPRCVRPRAYPELTYKPRVSLLTATEYPNITELLRFISTATGRESTESKLRQRFGDAPFDEARKQGLMVGTPQPSPSKRVMTITLKGKQAIVPEVLEYPDISYLTATTGTKLDSLQIVKAYKQISRHGEDKISVSLEAWAVFPRGKRPHIISMYRSGDNYVVSPLYGHIAESVDVPVSKMKAWIKSLPVRHFEPMAVGPQDREEAERLAKQVDDTIAILPLPSRAKGQFLPETQGQKAEAPPPTPEQEAALARLVPYNVVKVHDDGDLTIWSGDRAYVVTTEGQVFEEESEAIPKTEPAPGTPEVTIPTLREMIVSKTYPGAPSGIRITVFPTRSFSYPNKFSLFSSTENAYFGTLRDTFQQAVEAANKENIRMGWPLTPTAKIVPPKAKIVPPGKKLLLVQQISDFNPATDAVVRRGNRTFVVSKGGQRADIEVSSDILTPQVEANLRALTPEQSQRMALEIRRTPYLSKEGKAERLAILEAKGIKPHLLPKTEAVPPERPPYHLAMEEFHQIWEPQGWKLLVIGPTATWRTEWHEWEAIRDIVQNCLDETENYRFYYDDQGLCITDNGRGIAVADFLLGPAKPKPPHARGKFGEGMKIAALALLRDGYSVKVETVRKEVWIVFLKVAVNGEAEQLAALWRGNGRSAGTLFHIIGYRGSSFEDYFAVNIPKRDILHQGPSLLSQPIQRYNQLIASPPGRIYARDIYMKDINSPFSYNLWSFELAPDRFGPKNDADMWRDMGRLWATCWQGNLLERFLGMVVSPPLEISDESNVNMGWMGKEPISGKDYADLVKEHTISWQTAWKRRIGENALIRTDERWDGVVKHLGYESTSVQWDVRDALGQGIKRDKDLIKESQERLREVRAIPDAELTPRALTHLQLARKIALRWRYPPVAGVYAAIIPPASDRTRTNGLYSIMTQEIFIALDQLESASHTVDAVIHEIAHHTSGANDGEEAHNREMTVVAAAVVQNAASKLYDEELRGATW